MPEPLPAFEALAAPAPAMPPARLCAACGGEAVVHWRRRPTDDELAGLVAAEQARRDERLTLADPQLPPPVFPPLPAADDTTITVYSCDPHAIGMEMAARVHQASCGAPFVGVNGKLFLDADGIPVCDCTPEPHPDPAPVPAEKAVRMVSRLPAHWLTAGDA